jgi:HAE1 family hydrophobic/amphiphilic exporter-1
MVAKQQVTPEQESDSLYLKKLKFDPKLKRGFMHWLLKNTRILFLTVFALIGAGLYAYFQLPRELNPEVEIPIVTIVTTLPGANPLDVEELITEKIEQEVSSISTVDTISSTSQDSVSVVSLEFTSTTDPDKALADTKEKVDLVTDLPDDATVPRVNKLDFNDQPIVQIALVSDIDERSLTQIAKKVQDRLESESSIRRVDLAGEEEEEIVVSLRPEALSKYGLTAAQVGNTIAGSNVTLPAGAIVINQTEYQLTVDNTLTTVEQLRSLPLAHSGKTVSLGEVADIYFQSKESDVVFNYATEEGQQNAIELAVYKTSSATITDAAERAAEIIQEEVDEYPQVSAQTIINTAEEITDDFNELGANFRDTVILVFLVLFLFLGLRQATIASLSIPMTFLSTFMIMQMLGITLNFLSLFSLLLALGLVVDDAIVIVQAAHRYSKKFSPIEMGLLVFKDFVVPIWTTTLTTVWAFLPLVLATGIIGEFIKSIPVVVSATLISSTTIAVFVNLPLTVLLAKLHIPKRVQILFGILGVLASVLVVNGLTQNAIPALKFAAIVGWLVVLGMLLLVRKSLTAQLKKQAKKSNWLQKVTDRFKGFKNKNLIEEGLVDFSPVANFYRSLLTKIVTSKSNRWGIYALVSLFFIVSVGFLGSGLLRSEFFPKTDQEQVYISIEGSPGMSQDITEKKLEELEAVALQYPEVREVFTQTGSSVPSAVGGGASGSHTGFVTVLLPPAEERDRTSITIADAFREQLGNTKGFKVSVFELSGGPPAGADLQVNIKGADLETLESISNQFRAILDDIPQAINVDSSLKQSAGQIKVELDERELRERGLSAIEVGGWLRSAVTGQDSSSIKVADDDLDVVVTFAENDLSLSKLKTLTLPSQLGSYSLDEVADFALETSPVTIEHLDETRVVRVTAAADGISAPELLAAFQGKAEAVDLPTGYSWDVGGANEENEASIQSIITAMGLSVILILVTMVLQLNSFRKSFLVLIVIPLAVAGVFFNFTAARIPLSFPALIGVLALFGIVVNNSIMLVEKINQNSNFGLDFIDSVVDACSSRIEPIFFTSLTTTIGLLPITISDPLWRGLGGAIIAGLTVSGLLILFLLPALYVEVYGNEEGASVRSKGATSSRKRKR